MILRTSGSRRSPDYQQRPTLPRRSLSRDAILCLIVGPAVLLCLALLGGVL